MTALAQKVYDEAMALPNDERSSLALAILDSTREFDDDDEEDDPEAQALWDAEIDRRIAEIDSGKAVGVDAFKMLDEIRSELK